MLVRLDGPGTLVEQIYAALRAAILNGSLRPGSRLPSTRALAAESGVSRTTTQAAFDQLISEGYLETRPGSGTYVAAELPDGSMAASRTAATSASDTATAMRLSAFGRTISERRLGVPNPDYPVRFNFRYGLPPVESFPYDIWRRLMNRQIQNISLRSLRYGPAEGAQRLREAIAAYLARSRGVICTAGQVVVTNGSQQAIDLTARLLVESGDLVVIEDPHYQGARNVFAAAGARMVPCPVDSDGLDPDFLPAADAGVRVVYVTPSHQFPAGGVMPIARRLALLDWAGRSGAVIFEDDYDSEYRYDGRPIPALQGLDGGGRVVYAGTFSKVMFPSLRIGYVVLPPGLLGPFAAAKWLADRHSPTIEQETLAAFIGEGHFERHLRRSRAANASRREALLAALAEEFGDRIQISGSNAGIHVVVWFSDVPADLTASIVTAARAEGVGVNPVAPYYLNPPAVAGFLVGYASLSEAEIREGIGRLARVIETISSTAPR